jgi:hypothetical protein
VRFHAGAEDSGARADESAKEPVHVGLPSEAVTPRDGRQRTTFGADLHGEAPSAREIDHSAWRAPEVGHTQAMKMPDTEACRGGGAGHRIGLMIVRHRRSDEMTDRFRPMLWGEDFGSMDPRGPGMMTSTASALSTGPLRSRPRCPCDRRALPLIASGWNLLVHVGPSIQLSQTHRTFGSRIEAACVPRTNRSPEAGPTLMKPERYGDLLDRGRRDPIRFGSLMRPRRATIDREVPSISSLRAVSPPGSQRSTETGALTPSPRGALRSF